ncbi:hypothetical protein AS9A_0760 [Hoyosella subflava DQS3-9A1]|uniref:Uncharacterized protein n=1 Tax=Hoyosella subflava (strain DSM 45089 / JCM 17490 / NBRC 109087 / DQS3-9A1) TaxID=443218 RepID=F6ELC2_HOYSD|nr:hypothetical protein AS9A_0760 [Hoyosella subflava DQS3-9A1]
MLEFWRRKSNYCDRPSAPSPPAPAGTTTSSCDTTILPNDEMRN